MIVKDEALHLKRCLESVRPHCDEMVLLDTGSTDATVEIAQSLGATVHRAPWPGDFAAARNQAIGLGRADWILTIDADEELRVPPGRTLGQALAGGPEADLHYVRYRPMDSSAAYQDVRPLLMRRAAGPCYASAIHEDLHPWLTGRPWGVVDAKLVHFGHRELPARPRLERYAAQCAALLAREGLKARQCYFMGLHARDLGRAAEAQDWLLVAMSLDDRPIYVAAAAFTLAHACRSDDPALAGAALERGLSLVERHRGDGEFEVRLGLDWMSEGLLQSGLAPTDSGPWMLDADRLLGHDSGWLRERSLGPGPEAAAARAALTVALRLGAIEAGILKEHA